MISAALLLVRTSLPSVLVLAFSLITLSNLLSADPETADVDISAIPSLAPLPPVRSPAASAVLHSALFDPGRRGETISGSVDDLRAGTATAVTPVTIAGVLLSGSSKRAMLSLGGAAPVWKAVGVDLGGWRVAAIDAEGAVLERDGQTVTLKVSDRYKQRARPSADSGEARAAPDPEAAAPSQPAPEPGNEPPSPMP